MNMYMYALKVTDSGSSMQGSEPDRSLNLCFTVLVPAFLLLINLEHVTNAQRRSWAHKVNHIRGSLDLPVHGWRCGVAKADSGERSDSLSGVLAIHPTARIADSGSS